MAVKNNLVFETLFDVFVIKIHLLYIIQLKELYVCSRQLGGFPQLAARREDPRFFRR
jgi:hypothetical protein